MSLTIHHHHHHRHNNQQQYNNLLAATVLNETTNSHLVTPTRNHDRDSSKTLIGAPRKKKTSVHKIANFPKHTLVKRILTFESEKNERGNEEGRELTSSTKMLNGTTAVNNHSKHDVKKKSGSRLNCKPLTSKERLRRLSHFVQFEDFF